MNSESESKTSIENDDKTPLLLHEFFERASRRWPERTAVDVPPGIGRPHRHLVSYLELKRQSDAVSQSLRTLVTEECVVAILLPRSTANLYCSQLGILKAGAAYTCIDPAFPDDQLHEILKDCEPVALLTDAQGMARVRQSEFPEERVFNISDLVGRAGAKVIDYSPPWLTPSSLAYIIYTSGTTGRPKGVMIEHASISNLVRADLEEFKLTPDERVSQNSSPAYDSSVEEIWFAFSAGATLVVMDEQTTRLGPDLVPWLRRENITLFCPPPTLLRTTGCEDPQKELPGLSFVYVGGEALTVDVVERWAPGRRLENGYGPTECTVTAMHGPVKKGEAITLGRPVPGFRTYVLNEALEEVSLGERGELCLGGVGLARGYRNRPDLTAEKFPFHPSLGRIYRTGDLVSQNEFGLFLYHGRIDAQVKLRGYRIELEAIESRLAECDGVREAACRVQQNGSQQMLVAFIVSENGNDPRLFEYLRASLMKSLPAYMVPGRFAFIPKLPTTVGGKLSRDRLPQLDHHHRETPRALPRTLIEEKLERAFSQILGLSGGVDIHEDFFEDLGGDSLKAAELISQLRDDSATQTITVRDIYDSRTVAELAKRVRQHSVAEFEPNEEPARSARHPLLASAAQVVWIFIGLVLFSCGAYVTAFKAIPFLMRALGLIPFLLLSPAIVFAGLLAYTPLAVLLTVIVKKALIGSYQAVRVPVLGSLYTRNWMVQKTARLIPWRLLLGTVFQQWILRALGARIGRGVHIHRGVDLLQGGWDLLEIGDDVTLSQDSAVRLVELDDGQMIIGPVSLGAGSTLDVRAGVSGHTVLESDAFLTALSTLPAGCTIPKGESWDGIPAISVGPSPPRAEMSNGVPVLSPFWHGVTMLVARFGLIMLLATAMMLPAVGLVLFHRIHAEALLRWLSSPTQSVSLILSLFLMVTLPLPLTVSIQALLIRTLGTVRTGVISRWEIAYVRIWLKTEMVRSAGVWLSGTIFWPMWLRLAGMKVGRGCEISTIIDVIPELVEIGDESFFADGIYLCGPRVHRGTVTLAPTRLGKNTFVGNHAVVPGGQKLPDDILIGVCTVADDAVIRTGTAWFGTPPFELPRVDPVKLDRSLTHDPSLIRYLDRVFWEVLRNGLLVVPLLAFPVWFKLVAAAEAGFTSSTFFLGALPLITAGVVMFFCVLVLALKWILLGRVRPGIHAFWSCWCSRWDFLYVAWGFYGSHALSVLEGTLILPWYLRAMGVKIGRRVVLGGGFSQVVDPDMLEFEDGATVSCQFQAHTFEDRVLKIDRVRIRRKATVGSGAVLLYGADIGAGAHVAAHSVVMKRESLLPGHSYAGCPTRTVTGPVSAIAAKQPFEQPALSEFV